MQDTNNQFDQNASLSQQTPANNSWMDKQASAIPAIEPPHSSILKKIILAATGLVVILGAIAAYMFFGAGADEGLLVKIAVPDQIESGVPVDLIVQIENGSGSDLKDAQVSVALPDNVIFVGVPGSRTVENRTIGSLADGEIKKESFSVMAVGSENTVALFKASVSYVPGALRSRFQKDVGKEVVVASSGLSLSIGVPGKVLSGEEFVAEINFKNSSKVGFDDVDLLFKYPYGYTFKSADQASATEAGTTWKIGSLPPGAEGKIKVKGYFVGQDNSNFDLSCAINALVGEGRYDVVTGLASITLAPSPISVRVNADGLSNKAITAGQIVTYRVTYTNNTDIPLKDVIVSAKPVGEMFELKTVNSDGVLRASDNSIIWNASRVSDLASLAPGATGVVTFSIATKSTFPISRLNSKNFTVTVKAQAESKTVPANVSAERSMGMGEATNKFRGALGFIATGLYRDADSGIVNSGMMPPKVGERTQFTIHWILKNTSTDVKDVNLKTFLGPNTRYTGVYKSSTGSAPVYNDRTQEFSWSVPNIVATKGIISSPVELIFQVEFTPALDQIGEYPQLVVPVTGSYTDVFVEETRELKEDAITILLPDDKTIVNIDRRVKE